MEKVEAHAVAQALYLGHVDVFHFGFAASSVLALKPTLPCDTVGRGLAALEELLLCGIGCSQRCCIS